jgi:uncharacterized protein YjdB
MAGTAEVSYESGGCPALATVTVNPLPGAISGSAVCVGTEVLFTDATGGGSWGSSNPLVAPVGGGTGMVTGAAAGTSVISYTLLTGCLTTDTVRANPGPGPITGSPNFCIGSVSTLSDGIPGGTWGSSNTAVATVDGSGDVTGVAAGTAIITYTLGTGCIAVVTVDILALPPPITGLSVCVGATVTLADGAPGGAWTSGNTAVATIGLSSGVATGISAGTSLMTYSLGAGCTATGVLEANPVPLPIGGVTELCTGATGTVYDPGGGGTWGSGTPLVATVSSFGVVSGEAAGTAIISYTFGTGCSAEDTIPILATPAAFTGNLAVCLGSTSALGETVGGGAWSSGATSVATVGTTGIVYGVSTGISEIIYSVGGGACTAQATVTVVALPGSYTVTGGGSYCAGGAGVAIGLSGSQAGTNYLLYRGATATGAFAGTGFALAFGLQTVGGVYTVVAVNTTTGCDRLMGSSATVVVTPLVTPAVGIASSGRDTVCAGASVTYTATPVHGGLSPAYLWNVNGVNVGTGLTYTYIPANGDIVKVTLTSDTTCASPDTAYHAITMDVEGLQYPGVSLRATPADTVCAGMSVTLAAAPVYGGPSPSFTWLKYGVAMGTGATFTYIPANGDLVSCMMVSDYPCLVTDTAISPQALMTVDTPLVPGVTISASPATTIAYDGSVTLAAMATDAGTHPAYQWYVNGIPVTGATNAVYTKTHFDSTFEDSVSVVVTSSGICPMATHNWVYIRVSNVGVSQLSAGAEQVSVLPNPSKGIFTVKGTVGTTDQDITIEVTDLLGQVVYQGRATAPGGKVNERVTLGSNIANGMYLLGVHTDSGNLLFHIVVEQ